MASVYQSILDAVQNTIVSLSLAGVDAANVKVRKLPKADETMDSLPMVCVAPDDKPEDVQAGAFDGCFYITYRVFVVIVSAGNADMSTNLDGQLTARQQIRAAFESPKLSGVDAVFDTEVDMGIPFDRVALNANYDYSGISIRFRTCELRP